MQVGTKMKNKKEKQAMEDMDMDIQREHQNQIEIELNDEIADGIYSNLAIISHSSSEFVIDFVRVMPNTPKAKVKARIVLTPEHAKRLLYALQENVSKYEMQFGPVRDSEGGGEYSLPIPINFGSTGEA